MRHGVATAGTATMYAELEERVLERDQVGASQIFYDLIRAERPLSEIIRETVRIHAPYTHVPYHQRIDNGMLRFVNNDHCLLSSRASLRLSQLMPKGLYFLPMAQTVWYVPTGLDPWNQLIGNMPGHYGRRTYDPSKHATVPAPERHWEDQEPLHLDGSFEARLNHWLTLVERGQVLEAYRVFLGLLEETEHRQELLAHLVFAGLIDVQDRMFLNRSYTTGHKSYRARATVELSQAVGWDEAHDIVYAGVPDIAVGPRWHSAYEMACQVAWTQLAEAAEQPDSSLQLSPRDVSERRLYENHQPVTKAEADSLIHALIDAHEPAYIDAITSLLLAGKAPRQIIDVMQVAAAKVVLQVGQPASFSMPQHGYEYTNTLRWFFDHFDHPHRIKLLYVAGSFINQTAHWVKHTPGNGESDTRIPSNAAALSQQDVLARLDAAMLSLKPDASVAWTRAYLAGGYDPRPLVQTLAVGTVKQGNDPHNQEIGLCMIEDYLHSTAADKDHLLMACAYHTAGHIKYGDPQESYRRFIEAFDR